MNSGTLKGFPEKPVQGELLTATANGRIELVPPAVIKSPLPTPTVNNQILVTNSSTSTGTEWINPSLDSIWGNIKSVFTASANSLISLNYGNGVYLATDDNGTTPTVYRSTDLTSWTTAGSITATSFFPKIVYGNGIWVWPQNMGVVWTSTDNGTTWTSRTVSGSTGTCNDIIFANGIFVMVGNGGGATNTGGIATSTNGISWTRYNATPAVGPNYWCVIWNGTNFIVGAVTTVTNNYLYSSNGTTWTPALISGISGFVNMLYDPDSNYHVLIDTVGAVRTALNSTGILPASAPTAKAYLNANSGSINKRNIYIKNGYIYFLSYFWQSAWNLTSFPSLFIHKTPIDNPGKLNSEWIPFYSEAQADPGDWRGPAMIRYLNNTEILVTLYYLSGLKYPIFTR